MKFPSATRGTCSGQADEAEAEAPWRCKFCVFYGFCKMGRCVAFLSIELFTDEFTEAVVNELKKISHHESGGGFYLTDTENESH